MHDYVHRFRWDNDIALDALADVAQNGDDALLVAANVLLAAQA